MILVLKPRTSEETIKQIAQRIEELGFKPHISQGKYKTIIGIIGKNGASRPANAVNELANHPQVEKAIPIMEPYKLASRETAVGNTMIKVGDVTVGEGYFTVMAGPCAVESRQQMIETATGIQKHGARILRGGAFKPRTSPYDFQGMEKEGLLLLQEAKQVSGMPIITEVLREKDLQLVADYTDIIQIGARNIQNFSLLRLVGQTNKPVLLKRGMSTTIKELLMSAEYILAEGNPQVILCERGIRTFESSTRSTLDISAVPVLKEKTHLPVIVDPSHAAGKRSLIPALARAALAAGADGILIEVHYRPETALCDSIQQLDIDGFGQLMDQLRSLCLAMGKTMS
ncbi:MAG: 3-deoxy-7-phosphoheptulonate synthase [Deltaproteobacteria bacterium]|nr:3-deoxy-7-phosphoheptulonate synthase [Candidatus Anaeroferrophillus wilburensis]MBN2888731.1 3-deoxy-7-phosphoheptulonate synthase [Deltaproteobacteria bacterium]